MVVTESDGSSAVVKSGGLKEVGNQWTELIKDQKISIGTMEMRNAKIGAFFPILCCINNKDVLDPNIFKPCILRKVESSLFEVLDTNLSDKVEEDLEWDGDDGLHGNWNI